jgi:alkylhydroperoxidase/carboxymuconolactone decarboxylase family protein YurZ
VQPRAGLSFQVVTCKRATQCDGGATTRARLDLHLGADRLSALFQPEESEALFARVNRQYTVLFNDHVATPALSAKDRELAAVAALAAMGNKGAAQLPEHMHAALNSGATRQEITEGLATMSQASGTPLAN